MKYDALPASFVVYMIVESSTAKCAAQRLNWKSVAVLGSRSVLYWSTASDVCCPVKAFLSSHVMTGSPLMKMQRSIASPLSAPRCRSCRVTEKTFASNFPAASLFFSVGVAYMSVRWTG